MNRSWVVVIGLLVASCAGHPKPLVVKSFTLREATVPDGDDPMARGEVQRRLYGSVSRGEREQQIGQYYTVLWSDPAVGQPVEVLFEYQQAATGSTVKRSFQRFAPEDAEGKAEFKVIGEDFQTNGRVLAWRISLRRGAREIASQQSYLWE